jgi:hypothetical protein
VFDNRGYQSSLHGAHTFKDLVYSIPGVLETPLELAGARSGVRTTLYKMAVTLRARSNSFVREVMNATV